MLFLLSPAKTLDYATPVPTALRKKATDPLYADEAEALIAVLRKQSPARVARLMDLVNVTRKVIDRGAGATDAAVREATETVALALSLFAPYTADEMWEKLGYTGLVAHYGWRKADPVLLVEFSVTAVVQVDGKVRDRLEVNPKIAGEELEELARASAAVQRAVGEREIVNVIVRAPRVVSISTK